MKTCRKYVHNLSGNTHVRSKIHSLFYLAIVYLANEGHQLRIPGKYTP